MYFREFTNIRLLEQAKLYHFHICIFFYFEVYASDVIFYIKVFQHVGILLLTTLNWEADHDSVRSGVDAFPDLFIFSGVPETEKHQMNTFETCQTPTSVGIFVGRPVLWLCSCQRWLDCGRS